MTAPLNRARFAKLLALAESDVDGEALAAVRKAASMARAAGLSLGQAVEAPADPDGGLSDVVRVALLESELTLCRERIARLERQLAEAGTSAGAYQRGYADGQKAAAADARQQAGDRVRQLEAELEAYRDGLDWPAVADRFHSKNRRGARADYARAVLYRATTNKLTAEDQAELRRFAERERKRA